MTVEHKVCDANGYGGIVEDDIILLSVQRAGRDQRTWAWRQGRCDLIGHVCHDRHVCRVQK
jgi:hypothetical protein